ncbi:DMT family transporter [uncultured Pseudodesulfovibrio sp.]|uniref:DMT family transporter n=1 Tax=uncultured Pseudodesulfovibrio sp. TaxID=2035858 RepID=UPI0029C87A79|nr:DMT family transporter [uncultured Pseudodesulfovibrio sp.]
MLQGLIYAVISAACFGSMAILIKFGYAAGMDGAVMMQTRFTLATVMLFFYLLVKSPRMLRISLRDLGKCAFLGLVVCWMQTSCFVYSLETIPASTAALVLYGHPMAVTLLSSRFLHMRINRVVILSLGLVMIGCCLVFYDAFLREVNGTGLAYALGAMATFSVYVILIQVLLKGIKPLTATFYVIGFAAVSFTLSGDIYAWGSMNMEQAGISLALGLFPGLLAATLQYTAIERIGSAYACIFSSVEPVITLAAAAIFLGEPVVQLQIWGAVLIILGIVVPNLHQREPVPAN